MQHSPRTCTGDKYLCMSGWPVSSDITNNQQRICRAGLPIAGPFQGRSRVPPESRAPTPAEAASLTRSVFTGSLSRGADRPPANLRPIAVVYTQKRHRGRASCRSATRLQTGAVSYRPLNASNLQRPLRAEPRALSGNNRCFSIRHVGVPTFKSAV